MALVRRKQRKHLAGLFLLLAMLAGAAVAAAPAQPATDSAQLLTRAETLKTSDNAAFVNLLQTLEGRLTQLSPEQRWRLQTLEGWQAAYRGENDKAKSLLEGVVKQSSDSELKMRATATLIDVLGVGHHYQEAFEYLDRALDNMAQVSDEQARLPLLGEASQLLLEAGQYDLGASYANQIIAESPTGRYSCIGRMLKVNAQVHSGHARISDGIFQEAINHCLGLGEKLAADTIRRDMATLAMQQNKLDDALSLLQEHYEEVEGLRYPDLIAEYNVLLAQVYWKKDNGPLAQKYATAALDIASKSDLTDPLLTAYQLLYEVDRQYGDLRDALTYHEKYVAADKEHLDDVREKALAYQIVKQQVEAKKVELDTATKQNQILQLQQALDHKAVETSRLYIALLLTVLASIALWLFRLKRSQLRFMRLARRDGLTGIFNRQHFMDEAEQTLRYAAKSLRGACLILIDLDHFKDVNDTYGHIVGDHILKRAVSTCQKHLHSCDVFGRIGGEEFGILLPECSLIQALERAEQIRAAIQDGRDDEFQHVAISASFGIASTAHYGYDFRRLLLTADGALYRAKRDGRNRVVVSMNESVPASSTHKHASQGSSALGSTSSVAE